MRMEKTLSVIGDALRRRKLDQGSDLGNPWNFAFAFQPIVNVRTRSIYAYEALVRGSNGESAFSVLSQVTDANRHEFDQACRVVAIKTAAGLGMKELLAINFLPGPSQAPTTCMQAAWETCKDYGFPAERIVLELTECEKIDDRNHLPDIFKANTSFGFQTAIDDFGASYAGLNLLAACQPSMVKLDISLIRNIEADKVRQAIVAGILQTASMIGALVVAKGVNSRAERDTLTLIGIEFMQGFLFCTPVFSALGRIDPAAWE